MQAQKKKIWRYASRKARLKCATYLSEIEIRHLPLIKYKDMWAADRLKRCGL